MNVGRRKHHSTKENTIRRFRRCDRRHYLPKLVNLNIHPPKLNDGDKRELVFFLFITALYIVCIAKIFKETFECLCDQKKILFVRFIWNIKFIWGTKLSKSKDRLFGNNINRMIVMPIYIFNSHNEKCDQISLQCG